MPLTKQFQEDITKALKAGEKEKAAYLRFVNAALQNRAIEKRGKGEGEELTDEEVTEVFRREMKRKKEAIELFKKGGRDDLAAKEERELSWLSPYLPAGPSKEQIEKVVGELKARGIAEFSTMMKEAMKQLQGADGKEVSEAVKKALA